MQALAGHAPLLAPLVRDVHPLATLRACPGGAPDPVNEMQCTWHGRHYACLLSIFPVGDPSAHFACKCLGQYDGCEHEHGCAWDHNANRHRALAV